MTVELEVKLPTMTAKQAEIDASPAKRKVLVCGRRFGKTTLFARKACFEFLHGKHVVEAAPIAKQTDAFWRKCKVFLRPLIQAGYVYKNETDRKLEMGKGMIQCQTAYDADTLRGDWADLLLLDEYSYMHESAWTVVGAPMLLDRDGDAWFAFTPNRRNHAHQMYVKALEDTTGEHAAFHATSYDNPRLKAGAIDRLIKSADMTDEMIKQEIMAEFLAGEGAVFRNIDACTMALATEPTKHKGHVMVMGVDYAKKLDYTVISVGCATCRCEVDMDRFNQIDYTFQNGRVVNMWHKWGVVHGKGDSASIGEANLDYLHRDGIPLVGLPTNSYTQKAAIIESLTLAMDRLLVQFLPNKIAKAEMEAYEQTQTKTGLTSYSAPEGLHDDTVIARALMYSAMSNAPKQHTPNDTRTAQHLQQLTRQGVL